LRLSFQSLALNGRFGNRKRTERQVVHIHHRERREWRFAKRPLGAPPHRFGFDAAICLAGCWNRWKQTGQSKSRFSEEWLGQYSSTVSCQTVVMRIKKRCKIPPIPDETLGQFGSVRLVCKRSERRRYGQNDRQRQAKNYHW